MIDRKIAEISICRENKLKLDDVVLWQRWKRSVMVMNSCIGEALGKLYVEKYFTEDARKSNRKNLV